MRWEHVDHWEIMLFQSENKISLHSLGTYQLEDSLA